MTTFLILVMLVLCVFMVLVVLVQRGRGGGLSGAFGSGGGSSSAFGTKTGDVFTTITVIAFVVFMLLSIWLSFRFKHASAPAVILPVVTTAPGTGGPIALPPPLSPPSPERLATTSAPSASPPATSPTTLPAAPR